MKTFINKKFITLFILSSFSFLFAQSSFLLSQNYSQKIHPDSSFFVVQSAYSQLVDYEAYETAQGKKVLASVVEAIKKNETVQDDTLRLYRKAVLEGIFGTILLKRASYIQGLAKMNESQKTWERLVNSKFANEANFALALAQYYKITLFNKSPKNSESLNMTLDKMRKALFGDNDEVKLYLSLSYIWVLQEQKLWNEADKIFEVFFEKYPKNTMMLRAKQTILTDKNAYEEIKILSKNLYDLSANRTPQNYSDMLSAKRALIFASDKNEACEIANSAIVEYQIIPAESKKTYLIKKHYEAIKKYSEQCRK